MVACPIFRLFAGQRVAGVCILYRVQNRASRWSGHYTYFIAMPASTSPYGEQVKRLSLPAKLDARVRLIWARRV